MARNHLDTGASPGQARPDGGSVRNQPFRFRAKKQTIAATTTTRRAKVILPSKVAGLISKWRGVILIRPHQPNVLRASSHNIRGMTRPTIGQKIRTGEEASNYCPPSDPVCPQSSFSFRNFSAARAVRKSSGQGASKAIFLPVRGWRNARLRA